ncbi:uncharacterized protein SCODWIG_03642 [Saccharomycodes ludwigii]|uniref:Transcription activator GCR1-like domain-containing protein n=1 Tax=Saccharomycodes ludwigii TaxID=36035 RepID=A0A376BBB5_9ASCO|nr:uncharacterized protein SCODWIG_03642 [Saccharomycodes ludwigii]
MLFSRSLVATPTTVTNNISTSNIPNHTPDNTSSNLQKEPSIVESTIQDNNTNNNDAIINNFVVDQVSQMQQVQEKLKIQMDNFSKEQEAFYLHNSAKMTKMEQKFDKVHSELKNVLGFFHEVVGIMNGSRVWNNNHLSSNSASKLESNRADSSATSNTLSTDKNKNNGGNPTVSAVIENSNNTDCELTKNVRSNVSNILTTALSLDEQIIRQSRIKQEPIADAELLERVSVNIKKRRRGQAVLDNESIAEPGEHIYKLNRALETVTDVAQEYFHGLKNHPSVLSLDSKYGPRWRKNDRSFYTKRKTIITKILEVKNNPANFNINGPIDLKTAIRVVENIRLGNNLYGREDVNRPLRMTLNQLYTYFSAHKDDKRQDYSIHLKKVGKTRKQYALMNKYMRNNRTGSNAVSNAPSIEPSSVHPFGTNSVRSLVPSPTIPTETRINGVNTNANMTVTNTSANNNESTPNINLPLLTSDRTNSFNINNNNSNGGYASRNFLRNTNNNSDNNHDDIMLNIRNTSPINTRFHQTPSFNEHENASERLNSSDEDSW